MSDTTGWTRDSEGGAYCKMIDNGRYVIVLRGGWVVFRNRVKTSAHRTLALAKRAAHEHAAQQEAEK